MHFSAYIINAAIETGICRIMLLNWMLIKPCTCIIGKTTHYVWNHSN